MHICFRCGGISHGNKKDVYSIAEGIGPGDQFGSWLRVGQPRIVDRQELKGGSTFHEEEVVGPSIDDQREGLSSFVPIKDDGGLANKEVLSEGCNDGCLEARLILRDVQDNLSRSQEQQVTKAVEQSQDQKVTKAIT